MAVAIPVQDQRLQINPAVTLSLKERIAIYGSTGTGKTTFVRQLLFRLWNAFRDIPTNIIDSKGAHEYDDLATRLVVDSLAPEPARPGEVLVWVIPGTVDKDQLDIFCKRIQNTQRPCITLADEIANFGNAENFVEGMDLLLKQGRITGQMLIGLSQQYAGGSRNLFGQTNHVIRMGLRNVYDRRELNKELGIPSYKGRQPLEPPAPWGFFYRRVDRPGPTLMYRGWQEFFRF